MDLSELNRMKIKARWKKVHDTEMAYQKVHIPKNLHLKSRIHGYLCGDGCVSCRDERENGKMHYDLRFYPDHESMILPFVEAFRRVYGKTPSVKIRRNHFCVMITSITAVKDLLREGSFFSTEWSVPDWIMTNKEYAREWLRAFFDSEAYAGKTDLRVQSVNKEGLAQVKKMLALFEVECREYEYKRKNKSWNTNYHLVISNARNRKNFLKRVGFNHLEKRKRLLSADVA